MMIRSFNDVALALARDTAGSVPRFAQLMNAKARQMGMYNSRFANQRPPGGSIFHCH